MKLFVVTKAPVGLEGSAQIVGVFTSEAKADAACTGAGTYTIGALDPDRAYGIGQLLDIKRKVVMAAREPRS